LDALLVNVTGTKTVLPLRAEISLGVEISGSVSSACCKGCSVSTRAAREFEEAQKAAFEYSLDVIP
jgi:hypothetical protein